MLELEIIKRLETMNDQELIEQTKNRQMRQFLQFLKRTMINSKPNHNIEINMETIRFYLFQAQQSSGIELEDFIEQFNNVFQYTLYDDKFYFISKIVDLDNITEKDFNELISTPFVTETDVANVWYNYILGNIDNIRKQPRKLSIFDFNVECVKRMNIEQLKKSLKYTCEDTEVIIRLILYKTERLDKIYITDSTIPKNQPQDNILDELEHLNKERPDIIEELDKLKIDLYEKLQSYQQYIFVQLYNTLLQEIKEELELMHHIIKLNQMYLPLSTKYGLGSSEDEIYNFIDTILLNSTLHQQCLLLQVFNGTIQLGNFTNFGTTFLNYTINQIKTKRLDCNKYISERTGNIACTHKTFHYYTFFKWYHAFWIIVKKELGETPEYDKRENIQTELFVPQHFFCDHCHKQYKDYTTSIVNEKKLPLNIPYHKKYIAYIHRNRLLFYRLRYSDLCDISEIPGHHTEYNNEKNVSKDILKLMMKEIQLEIKDFDGYLNVDNYKYKTTKVFDNELKDYVDVRLDMFHSIFD